MNDLDEISGVGEDAIWGEHVSAKWDQGPGGGRGKEEEEERGGERRVLGYSLGLGLLD